MNTDPYASGRQYKDTRTRRHSLPPRLPPYVKAHLPVSEGGSPEGSNLRGTDTPGELSPLIMNDLDDAPYIDVDKGEQPGFGVVGSYGSQDENLEETDFDTEEDPPEPTDYDYDYGAVGQEDLRDENVMEEPEEAEQEEKESIRRGRLEETKRMLKTLTRRKL